MLYLHYQQGIFCGIAGERMKRVFFYQTDIGDIGIAENGQAVTELYFGAATVPPDAVQAQTELLREAGRQLLEYLAGRRRQFAVPLAPAGTAFRQRVWQAVGAIPYGQTLSYQEVAQRIGKPSAARAVGNANRRNPLPVFIPCHRVIGAKGQLTGYLGGLDIKKYLLGLEKRHGVF
ncbi:methylated-DNA-[protein]-cysteine S-methyltransferase [Dendrosporobacter quercicolus]|uniref:Methylated-DNA--protein-cysteine methyltransferase n=2 Tax=Dendrosporobacter quercicolus TaxID=146817 RepID=A0A1G9QUT1_9FIRM|nr:methylated-DNA-[protein]-cysteine S-methyltransferase [Dendrosporobacter quercicolus]